MSDEQRQAAIEHLQKYDRQFTAILDMLSNKPQLHGGEKSQAQEMLRELKDSLEADCKELHRRADELNKYERAYVEPALRQAKAELSVRVNLIPNSEWHSNLYGARFNITPLLHQLEHTKS